MKGGTPPKVEFEEEASEEVSTPKGTSKKEEETQEEEQEKKDLQESPTSKKRGDKGSREEARELGRASPIAPEERRRERS